MPPNHAAYSNLLSALSHHQPLAFLLLAMQSSDPEEIDFLLAAPPGETPLPPMSWFAVFAPRLMPLAVEAGAHVNLPCPGTGCTPLYSAVLIRDLPLALRLLSSGANPNRRSATLTPCLPLPLAAIYGDVEMAILLLDYGADS